MNSEQYQIFDDFRNRFKKMVSIWNQQEQTLKQLQKTAAQKANTPDYPFETAVVYNTALDEIKMEDDIKLIVIGDNPGKDEQLAKNNKYLVGQAGKIAEGYFRKNPELQIDFRKNVIILNKTPIHSAKTAQLKDIAKNGGLPVAKLLEESQRWMAQETASLLINLNRLANKQKDMASTQIWLVGYSELKPKGIFSIYRNELQNALKQTSDWNNTLVFQHFSMNRFTIDLNAYCEENKNAGQIRSLSQNIQELGKKHRDEIFC